MSHSIDDIVDEVLRDGLFLRQEDFDAVVQVIHVWEEERVRTLLRRLLIASCELGCDEGNVRLFWHTIATENSDLREKSEYWRRLLEYSEAVEETQSLLEDFEHSDLTDDLVTRGSPPPWEGITWCLDLLPESPAHALRAIEAYILAHFNIIPDGRFQALADAAALIRARYIGLPFHVDDRVALLKERSSRDFEIITGMLYKQIGYQVCLTPPRKDGGRDVIAVRDTPGQQDNVRIECKRWNKPVTIKEARLLSAVVHGDRAQRGVLVTTSDFTKGARNWKEEKDPTLELINGRNFALLLNEHLGYNWPLRIELWCSQPIGKCELLR